MPSSHERCAAACAAVRKAAKRPADKKFAKLRRDECGTALNRLETPLRSWPMFTPAPGRGSGKLGFGTPAVNSLDRWNSRFSCESCQAQWRGPRMLLRRSPHSSGSGARALFSCRTTLAGSELASVLSVVTKQALWPNPPSHVHGRIRIPDPHDAVEDLSRRGSPMNTDRPHLLESKGLDHLIVSSDRIVSFLKGVL